MIRRVLWSGGFDSTYLVADALAKGDRVIAVSFDEGLDWQKRRREREARDRILAALPAGMRGRVSLVDFTPADDWGFWASLSRDWWALWDESGGKVAGQTPALALVGREFGRLEAAYVRGDSALSVPVARRALTDAGVWFPLEGLDKAALLTEADIIGARALLAETWSCETQGPVAPYGECSPCKARIIAAPGWAATT